MRKTRIKKNNGITLIALVITIVVLLILAGVSIAFLTGENGIITQATNAREQNEIASVKEQAQLDIANWVAEQLQNKGDTEVSSDEKVKEILENANAENSNKYYKELQEDKIITLNGYEVPFSELYTDNSGGSGIVEEIAKNPKAYYGKKVTNYKDDGKTYRIFYIDTENYFGDGENTIYLKADFSSGTYDLISDASYDATNTKVRTMNPLWATERGTSEIEWTENEYVAACLCSPVNADNYETTTSLPWNGYYNLENANYVIGGPSIEMYVKSYNQTHDKDSDGNDALGCQYQTNYVPGYGYSVYGTVQNSGWLTNSNTLDYSMTYNSMYCGKNGSKTGSWWLASPSAGNSNFVCFVNGDGANLECEGYSNYSALTPLVSLKSSFIPEIGE